MRASLHDSGKVSLLHVLFMTSNNIWSVSIERWRKFHNGSDLGLEMNYWTFLKIALNLSS